MNHFHQISPYNYQNTTFPCYGFNGMEKDDEVSGAGNSYTTHFRQYDVRLGRWKSIDPKVSSEISPYASMGNNPSFYTDVLGDTIRVKFSKSLMKEHKLTKEDLENGQMPNIIKQTFAQEYGINVSLHSEDGNYYLVRDGDAETDKTISQTARAAWIKELDAPKGKYPEFMVFTNKGDTKVSPNFGKATFNISDYDADGNTKGFDYGGSEELKRAWNFGRTLEHEWLGHVGSKIGDVLSVEGSYPPIPLNPDDPEKEFRDSGDGTFLGAKTAMQVVNVFRVEMGLQDYQRLQYNRIYISAESDDFYILFGNPDDRTKDVKLKNAK